MRWHMSDTGEQVLNTSDPLLLHRGPPRLGGDGEGGRLGMKAREEGKNERKWRGGCHRSRKELKREREKPPTCPLTNE